MKKLLVWFIAVGLVLALAACGSKEQKAPDAGASAAAGPAQEITLQASNWEFDKQEYHVKKGQPVTLTLDNKQGVHGINIREFKVNINNGNKTATFTPDKAGAYDIVCSVQCGTGHNSMKAKLIVEE